MSQHTTFAVPTYQGARLRELAKQSGRTASAILATLIDDACEAAGIDVQRSAVNVYRRESTGTWVATLFEDFQIDVASATLEGIADALTKIADRGGWMSDLDHGFEAYRQGSGVILKIEAYSLKSRTIISARPSMSPDMARSVAKAMREALAQ